MTLEELEKDVWPAPEFSSHLVKTCHALRKKKIDQFEVEEFRILIGQGIGLEYLVPVVLDMLESDVLLEGDFFPGDVLEALCRNKDWLEERRSMHRRVSALVEGVRQNAETPKHLLTEGGVARWVESN